MSTPAEAITPALLKAWQVNREASDKSDRGTVVVVGGARRSPGAAMLTGRAALRVGAGRLTLAVTESVAVAVAVAVPESGAVALPEDDGVISGKRAPQALGTDLETADVVVIGPGLDDADSTRQLLRGIAPLLNDIAAVVLDAYALGVLPGLPEVYGPWAGRLVLTPNRKEAARLLEKDPDAELDLAHAAADIAAKYQAVVAVQGLIAAPDGRLWEVPAGNAGLGTSGSGDVLAGAIGGFLARQASPEQAACWGTYLHSTAGDRLAAAQGPLSFLAGELLDAMPRVMAELTV
ncbi:NAD(P)H-hydrate dehydratase [Arthrobacter jiangjiafuii]|uniref:ADP-dependent (S)-NAD(P)H-hydrate dehydratase n=1 Tax=Arthrobacter jiangjiafuii TaxID=2817475 RepID=A0A975R0Q4_9MICC|nr:NAD(P)H-hydrate dehydratase [Arthrobacter jiangjiafuii]MBP3042587.1 NAD(P)H-hydrate dehydratase [Arthrobacter jiangjiafuii]QWC09681.1 NAD(P)H-hydrate dehydratase [Arthrobacter jiangjiafuii]